MENLNQVIKSVLDNYDFRDHCYCLLLAKKLQIAHEALKSIVYDETIEARGGNFSDHEVAVKALQQIEDLKGGGKP